MVSEKSLGFGFGKFGIVKKSLGIGFGQNFGIISLLRVPSVLIIPTELVFQVGT